MSRFPVEVKDAEGYGRGVFATRDIKKGKLVEKVPVLRIGKEDKGNLLRDYTWNSEIWIEEDDDYAGHWKSEKNFSILMLGYGSLYNHADEPNVCVKANEFMPPHEYWNFTAERDIKKGEQLFIHYGDGYWKSRKGKK